MLCISSQFLTFGETCIKRKFFSYFYELSVEFAYVPHRKKTHLLVSDHEGPKPVCTVTGTNWNIKTLRFEILFVILRHDFLLVDLREFFCRLRVEGTKKLIITGHLHKKQLN